MKCTDPIRAILFRNNLSSINGAMASMDEIENILRALSEMNAPNAPHESFCSFSNDCDYCQTRHQQIGEALDALGIDNTITGAYYDKRHGIKNHEKETEQKEPNS